MSFGNLADNILVQLIVQHLDINRQKASDTNTEIVLSPFTQLHADTVIQLENFSHCVTGFWSCNAIPLSFTCRKKILVWQQWRHIQGIGWKPNLSAQMCKTRIIQAFEGSSKPPPLALKDSPQRWHWQRPWETQIRDQTQLVRIEIMSTSAFEIMHLLWHTSASTKLLVGSVLKPSELHT